MSTRKKKPAKRKKLTKAERLIARHLKITGKLRADLQRQLKLSPGFMYRVFY